MSHSSDPKSPESTPILEKKISRRNFIDWVIRGGFMVTMAGMLAPALEYLWPVIGRGPATGMEEAGRLEDIPVWGSKKVIVAGSAMLLVRTPKDVKAFSAICTHLGCIVDWNDAKHEMVCPCHAGVFDSEGRVVSGPPPKSLPIYQTNVVDGKVFIKL